jgi:uncharacterized protein YggE
MSSSVVTFVVENIDEARQKAYQDAFTQAKSRAQRLADLAGAKLGRVLSIQESFEAESSHESQGMARMMAMVYGFANAQGEAKDLRVTSEKLADIPIRVTLKVRFDLEPAGK